MIYAMSMDDGRFVKIGYTGKDDAEKRAAQLQTGNPFYIRLMFTTGGSLMQEQALHSYLRIAFHRIRIPTPGNEWYPAKHPFMKGVLEVLEREGVNAAIFHCEKMNPSVRQWGTGKKFREKNRRRELWG